MHNKNALFQTVMGLIIISIVFFLYGKDLISYTWETVDAQVIYYEKYSYPVSTKYAGTMERIVNTVDLRFQVDGTNFEVSNLIIKNINLDDTSFVTISISPHNPQIVHYRQINWKVFPLLSILGLALFVSGIVNLVVHRS